MINEINDENTDKYVTEDYMIDVLEEINNLINIVDERKFFLSTIIMLSKLLMDVKPSSRKEFQKRFMIMVNEVVKSAEAKIEKIEKDALH